MGSGPRERYSMDLSRAHLEDLQGLGVYLEQAYHTRTPVRFTAPWGLLLLTVTTFRQDATRWWAHLERTPALYR